MSLKTKKIFSIQRDITFIGFLFRGYIIYILVGAFLLTLPFLSKSFTVTNPIDALFTSTSAVTTTGLTTLPTSHFNFFGQFVILVLIQLGGIGYMTMGSFLLLMRGKNFKNEQVRVLNHSFTLPEGFSMKSFLKSLVVFTLLIEFISACLLYIAFSQSPQGENPLWAAIFHSVSAFCCAGFSLYDTNLQGYEHNVMINIVISTTSLIGGFGFIVLKDLTNLFKKEKITFTSKIIVLFIAGFISVSTLIILIKDPETYSFMSALFQSISSITGAGFNTVPANLNSFGGVSFIILISLMFIGAAPSGTGGGIKVTTLVASLAHYKSIIFDKHPTVFGHIIPTYRIRSALATLHSYMFFLVTGILLALITATHDVKDGTYVLQYVFESFSAIGTAGLSTGLTPNLNIAGKFIMMFLMFVGRVGTKSLAFFALAIRHKDIHKYKNIEDIAT